MSPPRTRSLRFLITLLSLAASACAPEAQNDSSVAAPLDAAAETQNAHPASSGDDWNGDAMDRAEVAEAIDSLASHAELVEAHAGERDAQMRFLARSLASDSRELHRFYLEGRQEQAAFLLRRTTENCVVCHTRLLTVEDSPLPERSVHVGVLIEATTGEPRAKLQMATRRFDDALGTLEGLLASPEDPAMLLGPLADYLVVSIRVKDDYERALSGLRRFAARPDLWERLRMDVDTWIAALPQLRDRSRGEPDLDVARAIMEEGHAMSALSEGHVALAHFVVASSILQYLVAAAPSQDRSLAEAYYLLGITETRIGRNYWVTAAPFLWEASIRLAPEEPFADEAFALLQLELWMSYEGSGIEKMPPEEARLLQELKALTQAH